MKLKENETTANFIKENKAEKKAKKQKKSGPNFFQRTGSKMKDVFSELKKVNWPTFPKIVKQTGIVLVVVLIFLILISAFDFGLLQLLKLLVPGAN